MTHHVAVRVRCAHTEQSISLWHWNIFFFLLLSVSGGWAQWREGKLCKNVISETITSWIAVETFFKPGVQLFLSVALTSAVRGVCRRACTCLLGGRCGGSTGCSEGYVWEWGSKVLAGLSGLLMAAIDWTSHTLSACALHTTTHLPHWHLAASPAWVTSLPTQDRCFLQAQTALSAASYSAASLSILFIYAPLSGTTTNTCISVSNIREPWWLNSDSMSM